MRHRQSPEPDGEQSLLTIQRGVELFEFARIDFFNPIEFLLIEAILRKVPQNGRH